MTMTKQDFESIALIIACSRPATNPQLREKYIIEELIYYMKATNPLFDEARFRKEARWEG